MDTARLVDMANRIGQFFEGMPDAAQAGREIAQHLRRFWAPQMRLELLARLDADGAPGLRPSVRSALLAHRELLAPAASGGPPSASGPADR